MNTLPNGWAIAPLRDIALLNPSQPTNPVDDDDLVSFIPMAKVEEETGAISTPEIRPWKQVKKGYTKFQRGDLLFAKITPCMENGKIAVAKELANGVGAGSTEFHVVRPERNVNIDYLFYFLVQRDVRRNARMRMKGAAGQLRVPTSFLEDIDIPVAPPSEQGRIVEEIEKEFSRLDAATAALKRLQANLKRYRASVLMAACEGRLVPTEADLAQKGGSQYEPANKLLERILRERRARWEADTLAKMIATSKPPKDDGWKRRYKEPSGPKTKGMRVLPEGWCWASVDQIVSQEKYALAIGPFGSNLKVSDYRDAGTPLIFVRNIRARNFTNGSIQYVSQEKAEELRAHSVSSGDILVTKMGDPPGDVCIYPGGMSDGIITADCIKIRLHPYLENPDYVAFSIESGNGRHQLLERTQGVAQLKVSLARFRDVAIPLPPLGEQRRITQTMERQLSFIDAITERLRQNIGRTRRFRQAILHSAFSGKLVPQHRADEPASVLLERIRAERGAGTSKTAARRLSQEVVHA